MTPAAEQYLKHLTFFFVSLRLLGKLAFKIFHENDSICSPPSPTPETGHGSFLERIDSKGVGLGIVGSLLNDNNSVDPESPRILFGFQMQTHIPSLLPPPESPETSSDSGTEDTSESKVRTWRPPRIFQSYLSASEMAVSEEYTRVTVHRPNPKVTHIFNNCIVDSSLFVGELLGSSSSSSQEDHQPVVYTSERFLSFCSFCKKSIEGKDIFMLRGERAFCSADCRYNGILMMEEEELLKVAAVKKKDLLIVAAV
ncbi:FCS-Like Zinc finger 8-like [Prosopis cineraria]|uniref:FCS-Like Zinc finger 8-like n=1 Tax=Prosopis cineraria TaxID=364024 RepID=UPI00240FBE30|nr:FCS-Like Zinc finger 8-like [Prosopis cineraria]